jgi:hypothetical protein
MCEIIKLNVYLIGFIVFGPLLAVFFSFYGDLYSLERTYVSSNEILVVIL